jgi:hypothetical protein
VGIVSPLDQKTFGINTKSYGAIHPKQANLDPKGVDEAAGHQSSLKNIHALKTANATNIMATSNLTTPENQFRRSGFKKPSCDIISVGPRTTV